MHDRFMSPRRVGRNLMARTKIISEFSMVENFGWNLRLGETSLGVMVLSAIDIALLDILRKRVDLPLGKFLGGCNNRVEAYNKDGGWLSWNVEELVENSRKLVESFTGQLRSSLEHQF